MNVKELIELLKEMPQDIKVEIWREEGEGYSRFGDYVDFTKDNICIENLIVNSRLGEKVVRIA